MLIGQLGKRERSEGLDMNPFSLCDCGIMCASRFVWGAVEDGGDCAVVGAYLLASTDSVVLQVSMTRRTVAQTASNNKIESLCQGPGAECLAWGCVRGEAEVYGDFVVAVFVGAARTFIPELVSGAGKLEVNQVFEEGAEFQSDFNSPALKPSTQRPCNLPRHERAHRGPHCSVESASPMKAKLLLDGRGVRVPGYPDGNFVGTTIIQIEAGKEGEVGRIQKISSAPSCGPHARRVLNANPFENGAAVFTRSGAVAQRFEMEVEAGRLR
ncbi:hypothetical protein K438DRAFT_1787452 [Mycena galopus ATCC 62051]|nr:hypothetical protein K438DRAFT_1787452 [Mycena galopus ATCC 62051]